jgi:hypothetical protein
MSRDSLDFGPLIAAGMGRGKKDIKKIEYRAGKWAVIEFLLSNSMCCPKAARLS